MIWNRIVLVVACILGGSGVALGAYQAHGLERMLERQGVAADEAAKRIDNCGVAVRYQMVHALALLGAGLASHMFQRTFRVAPTLMILGVLGFSGGLYLIVFTGENLHWAIVPSGGMMMIIGWIALAVGLFSASGDGGTSVREAGR